MLPKRLWLFEAWTCRCLWKDPLGPVSWAVGPQRIWFVCSANPTDAWSDFDLRNLKAKSTPWHLVMSLNYSWTIFYSVAGRIILLKSSPRYAMRTHPIVYTVKKKMINQTWQSSSIALWSSTDTYLPIVGTFDSGHGSTWVLLLICIYTDPSSKLQCFGCPETFLWQPAWTFSGICAPISLLWDQDRKDHRIINCSSLNYFLRSNRCIQGTTHPTLLFWRCSDPVFQLSQFGFCQRCSDHA